MDDQIRFPINRKGSVTRDLALNLKSPRMGLPAVKEFWELSTQLKFDKFDDSAVEGGKLEGKVSDQPPTEDGGDAGCEEDEVSESRLRKKTKPPTVDEYQWQWKVGHLAHALHRSVLTRRHSPSLKLPDAHSFCSLYSLLLFFLYCPLPPRG